MAVPFKTCPGCQRTWQTREELLGDPRVVLIGYQVDATCSRSGLFLFNHTCRDTFAIPATVFLDLVRGPMVSGSLRGTEQCERHCLHQSDLDPCRQKCECAFVREVLQTVRNWPKRRV